MIRISTIAISVLVLLNFNSIAQEFKLKNFKHLEGNTTARIEHQRDINGQYCALVFIKHNFSDFEIESGLDIEKKVEKTGETWVWLSADEYRLVIKKEGYLPFVYDLKNKLKSRETYELIIIDEYGFIEVNAPNSSIYIDEKYAGKDKYTFEQKDGNYSIKVTRDKHYTEKKLISLHAGEKHVEYFQLKPILGELVIYSKPSFNSGSQLYINNEPKQIRDGEKLPLLIGSYNIRVEKDGYLPYKKPFTISENQNKTLNINLEVDPTVYMNKHKKMRNIWLVSTIATAGIGIYATSKSNNLYDEYQNATNDAEEIRNKIETYDKLKPIAFITSAASLVPFLYTILNIKSETKIKFALILLWRWWLNFINL